MKKLAPWVVLAAAIANSATAQDDAFNGELAGFDTGFVESATLIISQPETPSPSPHTPAQAETPTWDRLTGDWAGRRTAMEEKGVVINASLTLDAFKNLRGGADTAGSSFQQLFNFELTLASDPLLNYRGGTFFANFQFQRGQSPADEIGDYQGVSSIDADGRTQLAALWYEQAIGESLRIKLGKMDVNADFAYSEFGGYFMNGAFACPATMPIPTYPDSAFGLAAFYDFSPECYVSGGVFDGAAQEGVTTGDQGPATFFGSPADLFLILETGAAYTCGDSGTGGRFAIGAWHHTGTFDRFSGGTEDGTTGFYLAVDHTFYRENPKSDEDTQGLGAFVLYSYADPAVVEVSHHLACGVVYQGLIETRDDDSVGIGATYVHFADNAGFADDGELAIETFYELKPQPFVSVRPDIQYIVNPGGTGLADAVALGLRVNIDF